MSSHRYVAYFRLSTQKQGQSERPCYGHTLRGVVWLSLYFFALNRK